MGEARSPTGKFIHELRRRRVFRTAALYVVGAWLIMQVADVTFPALDIPERAVRYVLLAVLAGFPAALVFGWFFDIGPNGIQRTSKAGSAEIAESEPLRRSDYLILTALGVVVAAILYNAIGGVVEIPRDQPFARPAERTGPPVVAVLPFTATSLEGEGEFFATGVHDDLLTQLSKLESLRVISRTSVLEYKDTARNLREIGIKLGADVIMEGGVQVAGDQIRINAQLIDTRTDEHLWAETYDRSLSAVNIFDVQNDISRAITTALDATLTDQDEGQLSIIPTENLAAYRAYHHAMTIRTRHGKDEFAVIDALKEAVELDPGFLRAWAELVGAYSLRSRGPAGEELVKEAENALAKVRELAPGSAEDFIARSYYVYYVIREYDQARELLQKAIAMNPSDTNLLELRSWIERRQADYEARENTLRLLVQLDPRNFRYHGSLFIHQVQLHKYDNALKVLADIENPPPIFDAYREMVLVQEHRDLRRLQQGLLSIIDRLGSNELWFVWYAHILNRDYEPAEAILDRFEPKTSDRRGVMTGFEISLIQTGWLLNKPELYQEKLPELRARMEAARNEDGTFRGGWIYRNMALIEAVSGNNEAALANIKSWEQYAADDVAERIGGRADACILLGMIAAAQAAVDCVRDGLREPSYIVPFLESHLPFYDPIRETPEFQALARELEGPAGSG